MKTIAQGPDDDSMTEVQPKKPEKSPDDFCPVSIKLRSVGEGDMAIVAENADGNYRGIKVDPRSLPILKRALAVGRGRLLDYWRTYDTERGGDYMLWDICRICTAITKCPGLPPLKRLVEFDGPYNIMHNAYQAELMAEASQRFPGAVRIPSARKDIKRGDFEIIGDTYRRFEVKAVHRVATIELYDTGWALDPDFAEFLPRRLQSLQREAIRQVGPEGTLVAILWCDSAGEIVRRVLADREISVGDVFVSGSTILGVRDAEGQDRWFRLNNGLDDSVAAGLAGELRDAVFPNAKVSFSGNFKSVTNTHQWTALGRVVKINNRATPTDYDDEEFSEYRSRPMSVIPTVHLKKASDVLEYAERQRDRFLSLISEHPVDDRVHSYRELFSDERFMCAFRWAGLVGLSIDGLVSSFGTEVIGKAIGRDVEKIAGTIFACQGMLCGSVPSKSMADRIVLLVSSQDRTLPARVLRRLTKGLRRLLSDELALRSEDMGITRSQSRE